jgi:5-methyltetrahydrofolate--homocysteine methyltransferase
MHTFGPGVAAAFCGAILDNSIGAVWFHPTHPDIPIEDLHLEYEADNKWLNRIKEFCAAAMQRWNGNVLVSMTDLGGNLDILQTFLPGERLLMELYDNPAEVKRLLSEEHELWHRFYGEINSILQPVNPGYSDWSTIYSATPSYILQCDFSYMIGPAMFEEFALPEIAATTKRLDHTIYHLDGVGQLPHLDMLLALPELDGVQWVFGDGSPGATEWPEVRRRIADSGKLAQTYGSLEDLEAIIKQAGRAGGIHHRAGIDGATPDDEIRRRLAKFGVHS